MTFNRSFCSMILIFFPSLFSASPDLNKRLFTRAYERNSWGSPESKSGNGSSLLHTTILRTYLPELLAKYQIKSLLDAPCGDFNWMKKVNLEGIEYLGLDIVEPLIAENRLKFPSRRFKVADIINEPLPEADLMLCRDCIQHLTDQDIKKLIANIKASKITYLLASSYPETLKNEDIDNIYSTIRIAYRNLMLPPFNFPQPVEVIPEGFDKKTINLWRVADLPDF